MKKRIVGLLIFAMPWILLSCASDGKTAQAPAQTPDQLGKAVSGTAVHTISPEQAKEMIGREGIILLDVRTEEEHSEKHIPGSVLLPLDDIAAKAESVLLDKDADRILPEWAKKRSCGTGTDENGIYERP